MSTYRRIPCPRCKQEIEIYANPIPTVDIIIEVEGGICLIERKNAPFGWAIPGGFVDYGESVEQAATREALEETGLEVRLTALMGVYSDPARDSRMHTISTVFIANSCGVPRAGDDAISVSIFDPYSLPGNIAFDHRQILKDYTDVKRGERSVVRLSYN
ncbi:MAG: NUDIX hydrolase [Desulfobacteraceae bacterium]|nr:NUDIX hydrolase [Desulfobacteraceae bacterium]